MAVLDELALVFHEVGASHPRAGLPLLVRAEDSSGELELGVLPLDGQHPGSVLLGFTAPPGCVALGVVTTGWSLPPGRAVPDPANRRLGPPAADAPDRVAVFSTVVVGRGCEVAGRFSIDGGEPIAGPPESGVLLDLLLRALGCPTAPPGFGVLELLATVWLADLVASRSRNWGWPKAAACHWALQQRPDRSPDELVVVAVELAAELGWTGLRRAFGEVGRPGICTAAEAAWFDDGSFARWVLGGFPPLVDLVAVLDDTVRPVVARSVRATLEVWGLLP
jgi:hypothetical protein